MDNEENVYKTAETIVDVKTDNPKLAELAEYRDKPKGGLNKTESFASGENGKELKVAVATQKLHVMIELVRGIKELNKTLRRWDIDGMPECHK